LEGWIALDVSSKSSFSRFFYLSSYTLKFLNHPRTLRDEELPLMSKDNPFDNKCPPNFIQLSLPVQKLLRSPGTFEYSIFEYYYILIFYIFFICTIFYISIVSHFKRSPLKILFLFNFKKNFKQKLHSLKGKKLKKKWIFQDHMTSSFFKIKI